MPTEVSCVTIQKPKFDKQEGPGYRCCLSFRIIDQRKRKIVVEFSGEFIEDFFSVSSVNSEEEVQKILDSEEDVFSLLGLVRVEEMINDQSGEGVAEIHQKDIPWAQEIREGRVVPSSQEMGGVFQFYPQKKIGF